MIFEHSRILNGQLRADITPAPDNKTVEVVIRDRFAPENGPKRAAAGIIFLHTGDTFVGYAPNTNAAEPGIRMPDFQTRPDPAVTALAYTAATLPHPAGENAPHYLRVDLPGNTSPKVAANLQALGMVEVQPAPDTAPADSGPADFIALSSWQVDAYGRTDWTADLPAIDATELAWTVGGEFDMHNAPVSPAPAGASTAA